MKCLVLLIGALFLASTVEAEDSSVLTLGGFFDGYVAHESHDPGTRSRSYTTQALYQDKPYVNLAHLDLTLKSEEVRGRVAAQWGSSVTSNYSAEPDEDWKYLQEGYLGFRLAEDIWLDGGVFLSHIGPEGARIFIQGRKYLSSFSSSLPSIAIEWIH